MTNPINLKLDRLFLATIMISTLLLPIALNYRCELAVARVDTDTAKQIDKILDRSNNSNNGTSSKNSSSRSQSMEYLRRGLIARKAQENSQALEYYEAAIKADATNAYAFMAIAMTLGHSDRGIASMKTAATLFTKQGNREAASLAQKWLQQKRPGAVF